MLESMCHRRFLSKSSNDAWEFLKDTAEETMQLKIIRDDILDFRHNRVMSGVRAVSDLSHFES